tara:strand:- start:1326 stop:1766 length:441 start_codon:yes stop_codon:yes gene_type:complete
MLDYKMSQSIYNQDNTFGHEREKLVVKYLNENGFQEDNFKLFNYKYSTYDMRNNQYIAELKSRRCLKETYPDTMVGYNKIKEAEEEKSDKIYRFYFLFNDFKLYYWDFKEGEYEIRRGGRHDRGRAEVKMYAYINCDKLILVDTIV